LFNEEAIFSIVMQGVSPEIENEAFSVPGKVSSEVSVFPLPE
jgi:hypothetical protein